MVYIYQRDGQAILFVFSSNYSERRVKQMKNHLIYEEMTNKLEEFFEEYNSSPNKDSVDITSLKSFSDAILGVYEFLKVLLWSSDFAAITRKILSIMEFEDLLQDSILFIMQKMNEICTHNLCEWAPRVIHYTRNHLIDIAKRKRLITSSYDTVPTCCGDEEEQNSLYELFTDTYDIENDIQFDLLTVEMINTLSSPGLALAWFGTTAEYYGDTASNLATQILEDGVVAVYKRVMRSLYEEKGIRDFKRLLNSSINEEALQRGSHQDIVKRIVNYKYKAKKALSYKFNNLVL